MKPFSFFFFIFGLLLGATGVGLLGWKYDAESGALRDQLQQVQQDWQQAQQHILSLETQHALDIATQQSLEQRLVQQQEQLAQLQEQLAFYEHLLPVSDKGTVQIRALDIEAQADVLHYRLLLQRPAGLDRFDGHIEFIAHVADGAQQKDMVLYPAGQDAAKPLTIQFDRFLRTTGLLSIPTETAIQAVTVRIYQGKQLRATYKHNLSK